MVAIMTRKLKLDWQDLEYESVYFDYLMSADTELELGLELPLNEEHFLRWLEK